MMRADSCIVPWYMILSFFVIITSLFVDKVTIFFVLESFTFLSSTEPWFYITIVKPYTCD